MKKLTACLAMLTMISAMVSCGKTAAKNNSTPAKTTSSAATTTSENTSEKTEAATVKGSKADNNSSTEADSANGTAAPDAYDVSAIVGTWYEENALDSRTLTINADGTYQLAYRGGGSKFGNIKIEAQGSGDLWYCFCPDEENKLVRFSVKRGEDNMNRLCSASDGTSMSFVSAADVSQTAQDNNSDPAPAEKFAGAWDCGRCHIVITRIGYGTYSADIHWSSSASEGCNWSYYCKYFADSDQLVSDGMGICTEYADLGESTESTVQKYTDGSAVFSILDNGNLAWQDSKENAADGMEFIRG